LAILVPLREVQSGLESETNESRPKIKRRKAEVNFMTVILVLITFIAAIAIDFALNHKEAPVFATAPRKETMPRVQANVAAGFQVQPNLRYHQGHTWALSESPNLVRVGIDDFATKLLGEVESVTMPQRGQWIRQGQKILSFKRNGQTIELVSPIEGSVSDVNDTVIANPELALKDCYGDGWMISVESPDAKTNFRNLLGGAMVNRWMEECAFRLASTMPRTAATMADGGLVTPELAKLIPAEKYLAIVNEFFLS
jgi:glycine cleavage system H protein